VKVAPGVRTGSFWTSGLTMTPLGAFTRSEPCVVAVAPVFDTLTWTVFHVLAFTFSGFGLKTERTAGAGRGAGAGATTAGGGGGGGPLIGTVMRLPGPVSSSTKIKAHLNPASTREGEASARVVVAPDTLLDTSSCTGDEVVPVMPSDCSDEDKMRRSGELASSGMIALSALEEEGGVELHSVVENPLIVSVLLAGSGGAAVVKEMTALPVAVSNDAVDFTRRASGEGAPTIDAVVDSPVRVSAAADAVAAKTRSAARAAINKAGARRRLLRLDIKSFRRGSARDAGAGRNRCAGPSKSAPSVIKVKEPYAFR
jgi:hypothetical protein